jgi:hypothetical protein
MMSLRRSMLLLAALSACGICSQAGAETLSFLCITPNLSAECQIGATQLRVVASDNGDGRVRFVITNTGPAASSIADVYFDDGTLLGISQVINGGPGVDFSQDATPGNLPGGNNISPAFETTAGFSADSNPPVQPNGVNPGESLTILFFLMSGGTFADVASELASGELRVGLHVQGFASGNSASFVNMPSVPLPAAGWLLLSGLATVAAGGRPRRRVSLVSA